jgi:hypothetical protein
MKSVNNDATDSFPTLANSFEPLHYRSERSGVERTVWLTRCHKITKSEISTKHTHTRTHIYVYTRAQVCFVMPNTLTFKHTR